MTGRRKGVYMNQIAETGSTTRQPGIFRIEMRDSRDFVGDQVLMRPADVEFRAH
jgi:hypothetical protein